MTVRLAPMHRLALARLAEAWGCSRSEALRRAVMDADDRERARSASEDDRGDDVP